MTPALVSDRVDDLVAERSLGGTENPVGSPFASAPFLVIWEVTRECALACVHCRADATPQRSPDELRL